jgi:heme exporter protein D
MSEFFRMGGYGFYVWGSYGMLALCIAVELWQLKRRRAEARQRAQEAAEEIYT